MKNICSLFFVLFLLLMGCSSTSNINMYTSKEEFYNVVNKSITDKDIKVVLINDSTISLGNGAVVDNDTLSVVKEISVIKHMKYVLADLKKLDYKDNNDKAAHIVFQNGEEYDCDKIKTKGDSVYCDISKSVQKRKNIIAINKVKVISYKTHLTTTMLGILAGGAIGLIPGLTRPKDDASRFFNDPKGCINDQASTCCILIGGAILGAVIGGIIGATVGYEYIYQFNSFPGKIN
jgi:uncharacterized protein YcfL